VIQFVVLGLLSPLQPGQLTCEAWFTPKSEPLPVRYNLPRSKPNRFGDERFFKEVDGYQFTAVHRPGLSVIEMSITRNGKDLAASSSRVPTENNSSTYLDVPAQNNLSLRLQCEVEEFNWE